MRGSRAVQVVFYALLAILPIDSRHPEVQKLLGLQALPGNQFMTDQTQNVEKLTEDQITEGLASLPEWSQNGDSIQRTITF